MVVCMPKPATSVARPQLHVTPCPGDARGEEIRLMARKRPRCGVCRLLRVWRGSMLQPFSPMECGDAGTTSS